MVDSIGVWGLPGTHQQRNGTPTGSRTFRLPRNALIQAIVPLKNLPKKRYDPSSEPRAFGIELR